MLITQYLTVLSGILLIVAVGKIECEKISGKRKVLYIIAVTNVIAYLSSTIMSILSDARDFIIRDSNFIQTTNNYYGRSGE